MARRTRVTGNNINGILLLDKPAGFSSNAALQQVKKLFQARKAGHTGSLDPLATGMLPICFGESTKMSAYLLDADKHYQVIIQLGTATTTGDAEGEVIARSDVNVNAEHLAAVIQDFHGLIEQIPPMYSALKQNGQPLYKLARQGIEVERQPRQVMIHAIDLIAQHADTVEITVHCSKGTYIRTLAEDMGRALGCAAHVKMLRRTGVGSFDKNAMMTMAKLEALLTACHAPKELLITPDQALQHWPAVRLSDDVAYFLKQGQAVQVPQAPNQGWVRLYTGQQCFLGVGWVLDDGRVAPKRLLQYR